MNRSTYVVANTVSWHERRLQAAQDRALGRRILTVRQLAELLAGGFLQIVPKDELQELVGRALKELEFSSIEAIKKLPGMVTAICRSLEQAWDADLDLPGWGHQSGGSVADLAAIESFVRKRLPAGSMLPTDIAKLALKRAALACSMTGDIEVHGIIGMAPCWKPILIELSRHVSVRWHACIADGDNVEWMKDSSIELIWHSANLQCHQSVECADPRHEAVEALRWARELIASGRARPEEIAIVSASIEDWDDHFRALASESQLPIHFANGIPACSNFAGQQCAALAQVILHGISHDRVVRAFRGLHKADVLAALPQDWYTKLAASAPLLHREQWDYELERVAKEESHDLRPTLNPLLDLLCAGPDGAKEAGETLLSGLALAIWRAALLDGPAEALEITLTNQRVGDDADPAVSIVWGSAAALVGAQRKFIRLLGLNSSQWPRRNREDSLLPSHLVPTTELNPLSVPEFDRLCFRHLVNRGCETVYSRSRRGNDGRLQGSSPLFPGGMAVKRLVRARVPQHAMSESDRLLARAQEFRQTPLAQSAGACVTDWHKPELTGHDGLVRPRHPLILKRLTTEHSTTSLRALLTDPLAFLWQYCLGWREPSDLAGEQPVLLDGLAEGTLFHEMLETAVIKLEQVPGAMARALTNEVETAIEEAVREVAESWSRANPTPPARIWQRVVERGQEIVESAFKKMPAVLANQRTYVEVPFGYAEESATGRPWDPAASVTFDVDGIRLPLRGWIDRLDVSGDRTRARVVDYKTIGSAPNEDPGLKQGRELQRCLYAYVVKQLMAGVKVEAALMYPGHENGYLPLADTDAVLSRLSAALTCAVKNAECGRLPFGATTEEKAEKNYDYAPLFAHPAYAKGMYFPLKREARDHAAGDLLQLWTEGDS